MNLWHRFLEWVAGPEPAQPAPRPGKPVKSAEPADPAAKDPAAILLELEIKLDRTVQDLADGLINRAQFESLYRHYQNQRRAVRGFMEQLGAESELKNIASGESMVIRQRHAAKVLAFAVYDNVSGVPLRTVGDFPLDSDLVVGFFSGFRSAIAEIMGTGARKAVTDDGKVLIYVPGEKTTLVVLYSSEPADVESLSLRQGHHHFEKINAAMLAHMPAQAGSLVFNHDMFLKVNHQPG